MTFEDYKVYCKNCDAWIHEDDMYTDPLTEEDCCQECGCSLEEDADE